MDKLKALFAKWQASGFIGGLVGGLVIGFLIGLIF